MDEIAGGTLVRSRPCHTIAFAGSFLNATSRVEVGLKPQLASLVGSPPMGPLGHFSVGLAAKPAAPKAPLGVLLLAAWLLDILAISFGLRRLRRRPGRQSMVAWPVHVRCLVCGIRSVSHAHLP